MYLCVCIKNKKNNNLLFHLLHIVSMHFTHLITFEFIKLFITHQKDQSQWQKCNCSKNQKVTPNGTPICLVQTHLHMN